MKILATIAFAALAGMAHAETYDGVHPLTSGAQRSDVAPQAHAAAKAGNPYGDAANAGVASTPGTAHRAAVRAQAIKEAHDPVTGVDRRIYFTDQAGAGPQHSRGG
jgi:hypothetical protein